MSNEKSDIEGEIKRFLGYKFFREDPDDSSKIQIVRIIKTYINNKDVKIQYEDGHTEKCDIHFLTNFTAIKPKGFVTFSVVDIKTAKHKYQQDVIVCSYLLNDLKLTGKLQLPYAVCRQDITDVFYNLIDPDKGYVGVSVTKDDKPTNISFEEIMYCDHMVKGECINAYTTDTVDDILNCVTMSEYDDVLNILYEEHAKASEDPTVAMKSIDNGWCRKLSDLLKINNFDIDFEHMFNINMVDFKVADYLYKKDDQVDALNQDAIDWLNYTFKINAVDSSVIEFNEDINLSKFNNTNYIVLRDIDNKLYLVVYLVNGEYLESDLEKKFNTPDVTTKLRLKYFNKFE